jgi:phospholipase D1/2
MPSISDYFLSQTSIGDDFEFRAPSRAGTTVKPLIDGVDTFRAMEVAIASATSSVNLTAWVFNPNTSLTAAREVNAALKRRKVKHRVGTWGELLATVAGLGVQVRVLLNDFDPVLQNDLHRSAWVSYRGLQTQAARWARNNMQTMCSMHDARIGFRAETIIDKKISDVLTSINGKGPADARSRVMDVPRLWPYILFDAATKKYVKNEGADFRVYPASHHQKSCTIDRTLGFCGGLDINSGRKDTRAHAKLWHDIHCQVDGPVASDLDRNFLGRWNRELTRFNELIASPDPEGRRLPAAPVSPMPVPTTAVPAGSGPATAQLVRTLSKNARVTPVPTNIRDDIAEAYEQAIELAEKFIYIENQYVRAGRLADWILERAEDVPELVVILVLPVAPEEVSQKGGPDEITQHGLYLQHDLLTRLKTGLGPRFGMYSMVAKTAAPSARATDAAGSRQIYVHSKTMIVDDVWATVGSANLNDRSFEMDSESNIMWHDPASVRGLRLGLWRELLGAPADVDSWTPGDFVAKWNAIAAANAADTRARARRGFIVPHDETRFKGVKYDDLPNEFAELVEDEPDRERVA